MSNEMRSSWGTRAVGIAGGLFLGLLPVFLVLLVGAFVALVGLLQGLQHLTF